MKLLLYILLFIPLTQSFAQVSLSGYVTFPDSVGIDLIRVEVWLFCNTYNLYVHLPHLIDKRY